MLDMHSCIHTYTHTHTHIHTLTCIHTPAHTHTHTYTGVILTAYGSPSGMVAWGAYEGGFDHSRLHAPFAEIA